MPRELYIGLMSGTSLDGVDGVLAAFDSDAQGAALLHVCQHASIAMPAALRAELLALNSPGGYDELHRAMLAAEQLVRLYAQVVERLLVANGTAAHEVRAIGAHGQTVRHRPGQLANLAPAPDQAFHSQTGYTVQLNQPALLAELTYITVVADFRSRDVAAGGQGAPLVPAFHQSVFATRGELVQVLNVGGISNLTVLDGAAPLPQRVLGFDCGPGNALMDGWCQAHTGQAYDANGDWAASGTVDEALLHSLLQEPFLTQSPPKSTGRDLFNATWLKAHLDARCGGGEQPSPVDVQATLTEFTARACADAARSFPGARRCTPLLVCGGGALNGELMRRLQALLPHHIVTSTAARGLPPLEVEAAAFAWLARQCLHGLPGNLPTVTGAAGPRMLGAVYPA